MVIQRKGEEMKVKTVMSSDLHRYGTWVASEVIALKELEEQMGRELTQTEINQQLEKLRAK